MVLVAIIDALLILGLAQFVANRSWAVAGLVLFALAMVNWAYLNPRAQASRWLTPGLVLMAVFVVYPVLYTAYISLTNFQTGNLLDKDQAIERLEDVEIRTGEQGATLTMAVYRNDGDELALLVAGDGVEPFIGIPRTAADEPMVDPVTDLSGTDIDVAAPPDEIDGYELLTGLAVTGENRRLEAAVLDLPGNATAVVQTLNTARVTVGGNRFVYDEATDSLYDAQADRTCPSGVGTFVCDDVPEDEVQRVALLAEDSGIVCASGVCDNVPLYALDQSLAGWQQVVGFDNYADIFTNERIRAPFLRVLVWNVVFAFMSVIMTFALGLALALTLKNDDMRGRSVYRSIYIVPYAIPAFLSILIWRGLLNPDFGQINVLLETFGIPAVNWLGERNDGDDQCVARELVAGLPLHVPDQLRSADVDPGGTDRGGPCRRRRALEDVPDGHAAAVARLHGAVVDRSVCVQLQQLRTHLPAHQRRATADRLRRPGRFDRHLDLVHLRRRGRRRTRQPVRARLGDRRDHLPGARHDVGAQLPADQETGGHL